MVMSAAAAEPATSEMRTAEAATTGKMRRCATAKAASPNLRGYTGKGAAADASDAAHRTAAEASEASRRVGSRKVRHIGATDPAGKVLDAAEARLPTGKAGTPSAKLAQPAGFSSLPKALTGMSRIRRSAEGSASPRFGPKRVFPGRHAIVGDTAFVDVSAFSIAAVGPPVITPVSDVTEPRLAAIIVVPIRVEVEPNYRIVDDIDIVRKVDVSITVVIIEVIGRNPAALAVPAHVAPGTIAETAVNVEVCVRRDGFDHRITGSRSGAHVHVSRCIATRSYRRGGRGEYEQRGDRNMPNLFHQGLQSGLLRTRVDRERGRLGDRSRLRQDG